jgi:hypothetical protein
MSEENNKRSINIATGSAGGFYFMGFVGSAIYFVSHSTDFWMGVLGVLKSFVWPAISVYEAFEYMPA